MLFDTFTLHHFTYHKINVTIWQALLQNIPTASYIGSTAAEVSLHHLISGLRGIAIICSTTSVTVSNPFSIKRKALFIYKILIAVSRISEIKQTKKEIPHFIPKIRISFVCKQFLVCIKGNRADFFTFQ